MGKKRWKKFKFDVKTGLGHRAKPDPEQSEEERCFAPPDGWPKPKDVRTDYQAEAVLRALFATPPRVLREDVVRAMLGLWRRQYEISALCKDADPDLFQALFEPPRRQEFIDVSADRRLRCLPPLLLVKAVKEYFTCRYVRGQCPFCWGRVVGSVFDKYMLALFGASHAKDRTSQESLLSGKWLLAEWDQSKTYDDDPKWQFPKLELLGVGGHKKFLATLKQAKIADQIRGMTTSITVSLNTENQWVLRARRIMLTNWQFAKKLPHSEDWLKTHERAVTPKLLAQVIGDMLVYPHRDLTTHQMLLMQKRFVQMRGYDAKDDGGKRLNPQVVLLTQTGAVRNRKRRGK